MELLSSVIAILKTRVLQTVGYLKEIGAIRIIIILTLLFVLSNGLINAFKNEMISYTIGGAAVISLISLHYKRKDDLFLMAIGYNYRFVFIIEYTLLLLPIIILSIYTKNWILVLLVIPVAVVVAFLPKSQRQNSGTPYEMKFISSLSFEWKSGLRMHFPSLLVFYILCLSFIYVFWVTPILLLFLSLVISSFYLECEPLLMLQVWNVSPNIFIRTKLKQMVINYLVLLCPIILFYLIFNPLYWHLLLYSLIGGLSICSLSILLKYSMYEPLISLRFNNVLLGIMLVAFLVPFLAGAAIFLIIRNYKKSISNLESYLYGY